MREEENPLLVSGPVGESKSESLIRRSWLESKKICAVAGPAIFGRLCLYSMTVITQAFAGHLNDLDLAAISIATTVFIAVSFACMLGMASALETLCGQAYGAKQWHMLGIYMQRSWIVLFLSSIILLPMFVFATPLLKLIGTSTLVAEQTGLVAIWLIPLHLCFPFQFALQRFFLSQLKTAVIAWVSAGALLVHVIISWVFVYKLRMGIVGAAITLDFSWWVSVVGLFGYTVFGGCPLTWTGFSTQAFAGLWEFFKLSVASGVMLMLENFYYRVLIIVAGVVKNDESAIDALSICITIFGWVYMIPLGFFAATGVRVANELGAGNAKGAKFATQVSVFTSSILGLFFCLVILGFPKQLATIFTSTTSVITMVDELALLLAITIFLNSIQPVLSGMAVGSGWQAFVAFVNMFSYYIVGLPLGVVFGWLLQFGIKGLWAGMISGTVVQTFILSILAIRCNWEKEAQKVSTRMGNGANSIPVSK